jgi:hypothetical protein
MRRSQQVLLGNRYGSPLGYDDKYYGYDEDDDAAKERNQEREAAALLAGEDDEDGQRMVSGSFGIETPESGGDE